MGQGVDEMEGQGTMAPEGGMGQQELLAYMSCPISCGCGMPPRALGPCLPFVFKRDSEKESHPCHRKKGARRPFDSLGLGNLEEFLELRIQDLRNNKPGSTAGSRQLLDASQLKEGSCCDQA